VLSLHIPAANAAVFAVSLMVGYAVYRRSTYTHAGATPKGDLAMALGATATCVLVLAFLFGLGDGQASPPAAPPATEPGVSASPTS
jgi:hypothetical protein